MAECLTVTLWTNIVSRIILSGAYLLHYSDLDKDLDQWVFHPLLFNLMSNLLHM